MSQRLERLVNLLAALIDTRRPLSRDDIYAKVPGYSGNEQAKRRAFERDKDTLRQIGVPLKTEPLDPNYPEHGEGYLVPPDDYYLPDPGLTRDELSALAVAASSIKLSDKDPRHALWKLGADTTAQPSREVVQLPDNERLESILEARRSRRTITFTYKGIERQVDPYRLTLRNGHWYVNGLDHKRNDTRTYRLDRIEEPLALGAANGFAPPAPVTQPWLAPWEMGEEEPVQAQVRIDSSQAPLAIDIAGPDSVAEHRDDGSIVLDLRVTNTHAFMSFVFDFLEHGEVLGPQPLRDKVIERIVAITQQSVANPATQRGAHHG